MAELAPVATKARFTGRRNLVGHSPGRTTSDPSSTKGWAPTRPVHPPDHRLRARDLGRFLDWDRTRLSHKIRRIEQRELLPRSKTYRAHICTMSA
jgi:hypothetical protein